MAMPRHSSSKHGLAPYIPKLPSSHQHLNVRHLCVLLPAAEPTFEALEMLDLASCTEMAVLPPALARMGGLLWLRLHKLGRRRDLELPEALQGLQHLVLGPLQGVRAAAGLSACPCADGVAYM
jgi:hypothetical protein